MLHDLELKDFAYGIRETVEIDHTRKHLCTQTSKLLICMSDY
jgi:transcription initiation factor IIF auxiliary subunit